MSFRRAEVAVVLFYLSLIGAAVLVADSVGHAWLSVAIAGFGCLVVGWQTGRWIAVALAFFPLIIAVPFGYADTYVGSEAPMLWVFEALLLPVYASLIAGAVWARRYQRSSSARHHAG